MQERVGSDVPMAKGVLVCLGDKDEEVRASADSYVRRLPDEAAFNDAIYESLVRTKASGLTAVVREQGRVPARFAPRRTPGSVPGDIKLDLATGGHRDIGHPQAFRLSHLGAQHHGEQR